MPLLSTDRTISPQGTPFAKVKIVFISGSAVLGAFIAGSLAPAILDFLFNAVSNILKERSQEKSSLSERPSELVRAPVAQKSTKVEVSKSGTQTKSGVSEQRPTQLKAGIQEPTPTEDRVSYPAGHTFIGILPVAIAGALLGARIGSWLINFLTGLVERWNKMEIGDRVTSVLGVVLGIVMSIPVVLILPTMGGQFVPWLILAITMGFITISVYILQSINEIFPWNRGRGPAKRSGVKLLDTNVIIDGRIYDVAQNGFLEGNLYVPQFVLEELQHIADHHDPLRRQRGKRGLEVLRHLQADFPLEVGTQDKLAPEAGDPVDSRLVRLARALGADLVTNDHNLNRVAALQDVRVLNLNDLALALRPNVLPQETLNLTLIREGNQPGQGVGYLDDGTMVVVENGRNHIGETLDIEVTQVIQTERGKMIFGEVDREEESEIQIEQGARKRPGAPKRF